MQLLNKPVVAALILQKVKIIPFVTKCSSVLDIINHWAYLHTMANVTITIHTTSDRQNPQISQGFSHNLALIDIFLSLLRQLQYLIESFTMAYAVSHCNKIL